MSFSWCQRKGVIWSWALGFHQNILVIQKVPVSLLFRMKAARFNASLAQLIPLLSVLAAWLLLVGTIFFGVQGVLYQRRFAEKFFSIFLVLFWPVNKTKNRRSGRILSGFGYAIFSHQQTRREFLPSEDPWQHLIVAVWRITLTWTGQARTGNLDSISCEQSWFRWNSSWKGDKNWPVTLELCELWVESPFTHWTFFYVLSTV